MLRDHYLGASSHFYHPHMQMHSCKLLTTAPSQPLGSCGGFFYCPPASLNGCKISNPDNETTGCVFGKPLLLSVWQMNKHIQDHIEYTQLPAASFWMPALSLLFSLYNPPPTLDRKLRTLTELWLVPLLLSPFVRHTFNSWLSAGPRSHIGSPELSPGLRQQALTRE